MIFKTKTLLHFVLILFAIIVKESFGSSVPATTLYGTISKTTTTFFTPPIVTSTLFTTSTPATSVKIITITATPSTSIVVSVTVANINHGNGSILPIFIVSSAASGGG